MSTSTANRDQVLRAKRRAAALRDVANSTSQAYKRAPGQPYGIRILNARSKNGKVEVLVSPWTWIEVKESDEFYDGRQGKSI